METIFLKAHYSAFGTEGNKSAGPVRSSQDS